MGTTGTKYVLYWGVGVRQWVPRVPSILLLCECFCNGYHGYQVYPVLGCGVAIYGYHGYQVYFFCVSVFVMGTTGTRYCIGVWGCDLWVPRVPNILLLCECFCNGYHGYQVFRFFIMGTTGTNYQVCPVLAGLWERFMGTTGTKYTSFV